MKFFGYTPYYFFYPVILYLCILTPYALIYCLINYEGNEDLQFLVSYLAVFLLTVLSFRFVQRLVNKLNSNIRFSKYLGIRSILIIFFIFLILASLLVNPMSFLFIIAPIKSNIVLHLFIISVLILLFGKKVNVVHNF